MFHRIFRPAVSAQPGFIDATLLKLRTVRRGEAPAGASYRFVLAFATEEQRQAWAASPLHQEVWPAILNTLVDSDFTAILYDITPRHAKR